MNINSYIDMQKEVNKNLFQDALGIKRNPDAIIIAVVFIKVYK